MHTQKLRSKKQTKCLELKKIKNLIISLNTLKKKNLKKNILNKKQSQNQKKR